MKVLHVIAPGPLAGAEKSVLTAADALCQAGAAVLLASIREARAGQSSALFLEQAAQRGIPTLEWTALRRLDLALLFEMRRFLTQNRFQVLHAHGYKALFYATLARPRGMALVATYHGATSHSRLSRFYEWLELRLDRRVDRLFAVSQRVMDSLVRQGIPAERMAMVQNPHTLSAAEPIASKDKAKESPLELLYLGRLSVEKGLDVLLQALSGHPQRERVRLTVVGDGPERARLEAQVQRAGLTPLVRFMGFHTDISGFLRDAHALILPSRTEGLPLALLEAAACGLPVIASCVGGVPEIVEPGVNGILVQPEDVAGLISAMTEMSDRFEGFSRGSQQTAARIRDDFSARKWAERALAEYETLGRSSPGWTG